MDKLRALRYFKRVAELNSFSLTALEFDVPASSISRRIRDLENALGVELIKRTTRNVSTTELGQVYYDQIAEIINKLDEADELVSHSMEHPEGTLRISAAPGFSELILTPIFQKFRQQYPSITLDLDYSNDLVVLGQDSVDVAIRGAGVPDERVVAKRISSSPFGLYATPKLWGDLQRRCGRSLLTAEDLLTFPCIMFRSSSGRAPWWHYDDKQWTKFEPNPVLICNDRLTILDAALGHEGLMLSPLWGVKDQLETGELVSVPYNGVVSAIPSHNLEIYMLYQKAKYQIPKINVFLNFLLEHLEA